MLVNTMWDFGISQAHDWYAPPPNMEKKRGPSGQYLRDRGRFFRFDDDDDDDFDDWVCYKSLS